MACWPDGICCSASFWLRSSTDRELSTQMQMAFLVNAVSVCDRIARCHRRKGTPGDSGSTSALLEQPFASSAMADSMDAYLLPELSGETWVAAAYLDLIAASRLDKTLQTVREWLQSGSSPSWSDCAWLSPELRSWQLQFGNLSIDSEGRLWRRRAPPATTSQLVVTVSERRGLIQQYHDSIFVRHLGVSRTVYRLLDRVYWPGLREDVRSIWLAVRSV